MDQLLIALDVEAADPAFRLVETVQDLAGGFKVGSQLFTAAGPAVVRRLVEADQRVFLDLKFHDIPHTVAGAVRAATELGVWMLTVHASGGRQMLEAARRAADETARAVGRPPPLLVGVTVLTSLDGQALKKLGVERSVDEQVRALAAQARDAGLDGVVASPREVELVRGVCGPDFLVVTPGIRSGRDPRADDQARTLGPAEALRAGATYLVVGRPIVAAPDPRAAAEQLCREMAEIA